MDQRKSQNDLLDDLVSGGAITEEQAAAIARAPRWSLSVRELFSYLAAIVISVGVLQIVGVALSDASQSAVAAVLYVAAIASYLIRSKIPMTTVIRERLIEVLEMVSVASASVATGLLLDMANLRSEWSVSIISAVVICWSLFRLQKTQFAATLLLSAAVPAFVVSLSAGINTRGQVLLGLAMALSGAGLIYVGMRDIGAAFVPRAAGSAYVVIGSIILSRIDGIGTFVPLVFGAVLFIVGSQKLETELLMAGTVGVVVGIVMCVARWVHSNFLQGIVVTACGVLMLLALSAQVRRAANRPKLDVPAA
ncbi:unannotated protein [freshwater metagenome]|uniref:Unannotated protein n=1 Tax=freshwater metagenome TaxID=449393 RepID=A0A6J6HB19_9ZZZZ|nr:hypothetical protein [Actinomycetota bacterium]